jgi:hypothetical protein
LTIFSRRRLHERPIDLALASGTAPAAAQVGPSTDDAWRTLSLVVDWIKHAESKATASLASAGLLAGLLYTLVSRVDKPAVSFSVVAAACAAAITTSAVAAGAALFPRFSSRGTSAGLIFYRSISDRFGDNPDGYVTAYTELANDRPAMFSALAAQIWANAKVATRKYRALNVAVAVLMFALSLLAATAVLSLLG